MPLQIRRGTDAERLGSFTPAEGELIYTTDTKKLYVGDGATVGGVAIDTVGSGGGGASVLNDLSDVVIGALNAGDVLKWNGAHWTGDTVGGVASLDDLSDVIIENAIPGSILQYDGVHWTVGADTTGMSVLSDDDDPSLGGNLDLNSSSITGNGNINITGDIVCTNEMTANVVNGNFHGSLFGDVFADDSTTILVDATLQQFNGNLVGPLATNTITSNSTLDIDVSGSLNLNVSADVFIKREGNSVLYCVNNQPTQDLSAPGVFHGIIGVKTIDVNGENTSVILGAGSDGFSISKTDAAYALPNSNKLFIGTDGKFGFGTITPTEKFDFDGNTKVSGFVQFGSLTTTERNALTAANGMVIYNSTDNKFQGYENGAWVNLV
jgi:hypothetical protein